MFSFSYTTCSSIVKLRKRLMVWVSYSKYIFKVIDCILQVISFSNYFDHILNYFGYCRRNTFCQGVIKNILEENVFWHCMSKFLTVIYVCSPDSEIGGTLSFSCTKLQQCYQCKIIFSAVFILLSLLDLKHINFWLVKWLFWLTIQRLLVLIIHLKGKNT